jgi:hypothetical protein
VPGGSTGATDAQNPGSDWAGGRGSGAAAASAGAAPAGSAAGLAGSSEAVHGPAEPAPAGHVGAREARARFAVPESPWRSSDPRKVAGTALAEAVRRYWVALASRSEGWSARPPLPAALPADGVAGGARLWPAAPASQPIPGARSAAGNGRYPARPTWANQPEPGVGAGSASDAAAVGAPGAAPVEIRNVFQIGLADGRQQPLDSDELAAQIAEILREQALRHGIDLT